jgi:hypothetical protein
MPPDRLFRLLGREPHLIEQLARTRRHGCFNVRFCQVLRANTAGGFRRIGGTNRRLVPITLFEAVMSALQKFSHHRQPSRQSPLLSTTPV